MDLTVSHTTTYAYSEVVSYGLLQLRVTPASSPGQTVRSWSSSIEGADSQLTFVDHHENVVELTRLQSDQLSMQVAVEGEVSTHDTSGVFSPDPGQAPLWLYNRHSTLTAAGAGVRVLAKGLPKASSDVGVLHDLSARVRSAIDYKSGMTTVDITAEEALAEGSGVCQDHTHVFASAARLLGYPARYVSGYLFVDSSPDSEAMHAWAEAWVDGLGWVGFDVSNQVSPDEGYVRLATGLDYREASPVSGIRFGSGVEEMSVSLQVSQQ